MENKFKWFGHVEWKPVDFVVRRVNQIEDSHIKEVYENLEEL